MATHHATPSPISGKAQQGQLRIIVRFTAAIDDVSLDIDDPKTITVVSLKQIIRSRLTFADAGRRLRLIHNGKVLPDTSFLPSVLKIPTPPPRGMTDVRGKGKDVDSVARVYVNCSIGDVLTSEELAKEGQAARPLTNHQNINNEANHIATPPELASTVPAPRGFDRLLAPGFTPAEVGQLRLQFLSIRATAYTPDTMPTPTTMRRMEDEWIDDNGATSMGGNEADAEAASGAIDDLLWGLIIGFMWPLGAMGWLVREQGIWSARRQTAVWSGFMLNLAFGVMTFLG